MACPVAAIAGPAVKSVHLPAQSLTASVQAIAQMFGIELLFSEDSLRGRTAPAISGRYPAQAALDLVLSGSNLMARRTEDGSYVIAAIPRADGPPVAATPEILVRGRRNDNADIQRTINDVRPYRVIDREDIATSHSETVEELAAQRLTANAQGATLAQQASSAMGQTASSINLRGLGTDQTLILVDGRRLPQLPAGTSGFLQPDVNALPPEALDRVETITATSGGIYGPGSTAGVVNLVLRRDYRGIDLSVTHGVTARGDAPYSRADLRVGFTPDHGDTEVMLDVAASDFGGLLAGQRDFQQRANARSFANDPSLFIVAGPPSSRSLTVVSANGTPLVLKPGYGGTALGSVITYAPPADGRSASALAQTLVANAGRFDATPGAGAAGADASLLSARKTSSIIASIHHRTGGIELFADYLRLVNRGEAQGTGDVAQIPLGAQNPGNPFAQNVIVYAPNPNQAYHYAFRTEIVRATGGVIASLPGHWRGEAEFSLGGSDRNMVSSGQNFTLAGFGVYETQILNGDGPRNPLADYSTYLASFNGLFGPDQAHFQQSSRFRDLSLRLAGPVARLPGGDVGLTLLGERRVERVSGGTASDLAALFAQPIEQTLGGYGQTVNSLYAEVRAPLTARDSGIRPLRGLEVQLAVRYDDAIMWASANDPTQPDAGRSIRNGGAVYTAGVKFTPLTGIVLRSSISTGQQPLALSELSRRIFPNAGVSFLPDPKRGNLRSTNFFDEVLGGAPNPVPSWARSISVGAVVQPPSVPGLRVSVDYTNIVRTHENVSGIMDETEYFIAHEDLYPGRVTRAPLTAADIAKGYTGGVIEQVDISSLQEGRTVIDAIDGQASYRLSLKRQGVLTLDGSLTWQPRFRRYVGFDVPSRNFSGAADGAVSLRANAGVRWTRDRLTLTAQGEYIGSYRITSAVELLRMNELLNDVPAQGGVTVPGQATLDLGLAYRFALAGMSFDGHRRSLNLRFGVQDVFDSRPVTVVNAPGGYNSYVDPRRRRFELTLETGF
ncbi:TonB-dependent receptor [Novosphingobium sp.]|uniref:TonB-dependent receptor n=1 Tax=Novosphingobium sp. TaxID=1874826 RepID=UPI0031DD7CAE